MLFSMNLFYMMQLKSSVYDVYLNSRPVCKMDMDILIETNACGRKGCINVQ